VQRYYINFLFQNALRLSAAKIGELAIFALRLDEFGLLVFAPEVEHLVESSGQGRFRLLDTRVKEFFIYVISIVVAVIVEVDYKIFFRAVIKNACFIDCFEFIDDRLHFVHFGMFLVISVAVKQQLENCMAPVITTVFVYEQVVHVFECSLVFTGLVVNDAPWTVAVKLVNSVGLVAEIDGYIVYFQSYCVAFFTF
jgi:hypothetical protein